MYTARCSPVRGGKSRSVTAGLAALVVLAPWSNSASAAHGTGVARPGATSLTHISAHRTADPGPLTLACRPYICVVDHWEEGSLVLPSGVEPASVTPSSLAVVDGARVSGGTAVSETVRITNRGHTTSPGEGETVVGPIQEQWTVELQTPAHTLSTSVSAATGLFSPPMTTAFDDVPVLLQTRYMLDSTRFWRHSGRETINGRKFKLQADAGERFIYTFHLARPAVSH